MYKKITLVVENNGVLDVFIVCLRDEDTEDWPHVLVFSFRTVTVMVHSEVHLRLVLDSWNPVYIARTSFYSEDPITVFDVGKPDFVIRINWVFYL